MGQKKTRTGLKILTPKKLLTRLPILLAQIKAGKNSYKIKMKSGKYCILSISIIKSPKKFTTNNQVIVIMEENIIVIRDPKTFYFDFGWPKAVD